MLGFNVNYSQFQSAIPLQSEVRKKRERIKKKKKKKKKDRKVSRKEIHSLSNVITYFPRNIRFHNNKPLLRTCLRAGGPLIFVV